MTYAFTFDASACTGCKACQVACKDKNNLPAGVLWRRVFEVSGGDWVQTGGAWQNSVFAYNLSIGCNHCVHPKCAGVCPADAYVQREDGVVYIDESKCMGCGYCAWACPYGVPQYNPLAGHMTKCNFCMDHLDAGLPPACVAACPMRVLDYAVISEQSAVTGEKYQSLWETPGTEHPFPLPAFSRTQPHLALKPHAGMLNGLEKAIANREEVSDSTSRRFPAKGQNYAKNLRDAPLVAFTLLAQMSAGMAVVGLFFQLSTLQHGFASQGRFFNLLTIGFLLGLGGLISFLHLGTKKNAWRAVLHLKKSWLSREILTIGLFGAAWLVSFTEYWILNSVHLLSLTALLGLAVVYSMSQVYRIKAVPAWNSWRTEAAFFLSAGILGLTGVAFGAGLASAWFPLWVLLAAEAGLALSGKNQVNETGYRIRGVCIALAMVGVSLLPLVPDSVQAWLNLPILLLILSEQVFGRWLFYEARVPAL
jgi:anaerobic dimethyl sulfoxide reductase subunit B (iron-sulfur subunit)